MAKIEIERKPRRSLLPLLLALIVIAAIAVGVYYYMERQRAATPPAQTPPATPGAMNEQAPPELPALPIERTLSALRAPADARAPVPWRAV